jgi:HEAT repeat protein
VTEALLGRLISQDGSVRAAAVEALADRQDPKVTEALLGRLADHDWSVRAAVVEALAGRQDPAVTEAPLGCLTGRHKRVRAAAVAVLGASESPETLLIVARKVRTLSQPSLLAVTEAAEPLTIRHYRRIDPADQPEVLAAMGWPTTAALSEGPR